MSNSDFKNALINNTMNIFNSLSFYSPIFVCTSVIILSIFTNSIIKAAIFFLWIFIITFIRILVFKGIKSKDEVASELPSVCLTGVSEIFIPKDITYSTFILAFSLMYFFIPMVLVTVQTKVNVINYGVLALFIVYIMLDLFVKKSLACIPSIFSKLIISDVLGGLFLGGIIAGLIMYPSVLRPFLFINEINSNKEVCRVPNNQQFKCKVYKNGELIGNV